MLPLNVAPVVHATSLLLSKVTTWVYWIVLNPAAHDTIGTLNLYDGEDANGVERARLASGHSFIYVFSPPIRCQDALYIAIDQAVATYTVGWRTEASLALEK